MKPMAGSTTGTCIDWKLSRKARRQRDFSVLKTLLKMCITQWNQVLSRYYVNLLSVQKRHNIQKLAQNRRA